MDMVNSEFTFVLILTMVRTAWIPNAYHKFPDAFTSCVFFKFAFNNFQCVITLFLIAPALISVALSTVPEQFVYRGSCWSASPSGSNCHNLRCIQMNQSSPPRMA